MKLPKTRFGAANYFKALTYRSLFILKIKILIIKHHTFNQQK